MAQDAIGMIETKGLIAAIEAADVMLKSANVEILGNKYHKVRSGIIAVIVTGDVGAVQSAVEAGSNAAKRIGEVLTVDVIARTDKSVLKMLIPQINKKDKETRVEEKQEKIDKKKPKEEKQEKQEKEEKQEKQEKQEKIRKEESKQESKVEGKQEKTNIEKNKIENKKEVKDTSKSKDKGELENSDKSSNSKNAKK